MQPRGREDAANAGRASWYLCHLTRCNIKALEHYTHESLMQIWNNKRTGLNIFSASSEKCYSLFSLQIYQNLQSPHKAKFPVESEAASQPDAINARHAGLRRDPNEGQIFALCRVWCHICCWKEVTVKQLLKEEMQTIPSRVKTFCSFEKWEQ